MGERVGGGIFGRGCGIGGWLIGRLGEGSEGEVFREEGSGKMYSDEEILVMQTLCLKY